MLKKSKKAQVWVETAIYTLVGLTIIAILLSIANPQIEKIKDRGIIRQTAEALDTINDRVVETQQTTGNVRIVDLKLAKGIIEVDGTRDEVRYVLENTRLEYSEVGSEVEEGILTVLTEEYGSKYKVTIILAYESLDLTINNEDVSKTMQPSAANHQISITNKGSEAVGDPVQIDFNF